MKKYIKLINQLANKSGRILRKAFRRTLIISSKGRMPSNTVTNIDVSVELALKKWIERKFPDHNIISEETKGKKTKSPYT
jgi:fructose-1,6-bisphosphatase/inositol monophosphatase family enzyme